MDDKGTAAKTQVQPEVSDEQLAQWASRHGEIFEVEAEDDEHEEIAGRVFYFKVPGKPELSRFIQKATKNAYNAMRWFVFDLALHPSKDELERIFAKKPGLLVSLGNAVQKKTGVGADFSVRKR